MYRQNFCYRSHFSHVTKSRIFKILNLKEKSRSQLSWHFPEKPSYIQIPQADWPGVVFKDKRLKFTFSREPTFQVLVRGSSAPKKTQIDKNKYFFIILDLDPPRNQKFGLFPMVNSLYKKNLWCQSQELFGLKIGTFPRLLVAASYPCRIGALPHLLWPSGWHLTSEAQLNQFSFTNSKGQHGFSG